MMNLEYRRQAAHLLYGVLLAIGVAYDLLFDITILLLLIFSLVITFIARYNIPILSSILQILERTEEKKAFRAKGLFYYTLGCGLTILLFDKVVAIVAILTLAFGDSLPNVFSKNIKHPFNKKKHLDGTLFGWLVSAVAAAQFVNPYHAIIATGIVLFLEGIDLHVFGWKVDDNLFIPLLTGLFLTLLSLI